MAALVSAFASSSHPRKRKAKGRGLVGAVTAPMSGGMYVKPAVQVSPPPGQYDPSIDAQVGAGGRGLSDLTLDTETAKERGGQDLNSTLAQLVLGRTRAGEDRTKALGDVQLGYTRLGRRQGEQDAQMGVLSDQVAQRQAAVRAGNQQRDQAPINQAYDRYMADSQTQEGQARQTYDRQFGEFGDLSTHLLRANRENTFLGLDANQQKWFQAGQLGYTPPQPYTTASTPVKKKKKKKV